MGLSWSVWVTDFTACDRRRTGASTAWAAHSAANVVVITPSAPAASRDSHSDDSVDSNATVGRPYITA